MIIEKGSTLLFNGDSITDFGRARPVGESPCGLGNGYVQLVEGMLTAFASTEQVRVVNTAVSGDTIRMMASRWEQDTLLQNPDWVAVMIGINDVWRHFDTPFRKDLAVHYDEYVKTYRQLIELTLPKVKGMVLMTPYYVDNNLSDPMTAMVHQYADAVRQLAAEYKLVLCDVQAEMDEVQKTLHHMAFSADRVHPNGGNPVGAFIIAKAFLKSIGATGLV